MMTSLSDKHSTFSIRVESQEIKQKNQQKREVCFTYLSFLGIIERYARYVAILPRSPREAYSSHRQIHSFLL